MLVFGIATLIELGERNAKFQYEDGSFFEIYNFDKFKELHPELKEGREYEILAGQSRTPPENFLINNFDIVRSGDNKWPGIQIQFVNRPGVIKGKLEKNSIKLHIDYIFTDEWSLTFKWK